MTRSLTVCALALVAVLLLCSDASACGKRRGGGCYGGCYGGCGGGGVVYSGGGYAAPTYAQPMAYGGYAAGPAYSSGYAPSYGYGGGYGGYGYGGYGYNPGGLGGPRSGLGVRPGPGFGGLGPRR